MKLQTFIFIGRSGCGKGTQVALLQEYIKTRDHKRPILYIETGERFRNLLRSLVYLVDWPLKFIRPEIVSQILLLCGCGHTCL
jgi:hypothetical protein